MKSLIHHSVAWPLLIASIVLIGLAHQDLNGQELTTPLAKNSGPVNQIETGFLSRSAPTPVFNSFETMPSRYPFVIARPEDRSWLNSLPIEMRPNRPLHFYGNTLRRIDQNGRASRFTGFRR